ncbi:MULTISPECIES: uracil-DNA glycosylase family protein [unclassified Mucilaginibacter]|uniref:uracil-DNA glycosylase family protein n=1 Tax=unclassified Mucilaginibacter TaxID=2617802 RepID=UPI002AC979AB|nr:MULTISPECIES: uracil-DNA glycosylase family protein [unclassified Mucilaginibacter]MEB0260438.1 DUF4918 family protein [Mucilaginibacter sp. 10I4]MEB0280019.1 DUF4918 family protein [Mucilaginibacter sp. 10B2]MEB0301343.1 DUF4918 family protein [Mucilaginibacter sp. 5C4]WPX23639.1 DUF4918 family protein [Mucilaginibacter sp. 5C4]
MNFADRVINFNKHLEYAGPALPANIRVMNPFKEEEGNALQVSSAFYKKYYSDDNKRHLIMGINPGRFGSGLTGVPFTDPKRLKSECDIEYEGKVTHEPSSVYVYEIINAYGGAEAFYNKFYISSLCPLGFTTIDNKGKEKNYNYYDSKELCTAVTPFIIDNIKIQIALGCYTDTCFCFGTGQNEKFLKKLNNEHGFFKKIVALEHPRFIMQYKAKTKQIYIDKYLEALSGV